MEQAAVRLADWTTLGLGGPAARWVEAREEATLIEELRAADQRGEPVLLLGGGSNLLVADRGFPGTVLAVRLRGRRIERRGEELRLCAAAGEPWDELVAWTVEEGLAGLARLSGIPGLAGAAPVQNIGAYGAELAVVFRGLRAWDRRERRLRWLGPRELAFGYRSSALKREPGRYAVLELELVLRPGPEPVGSHRELVERLGRGTAPPAALRACVLELRRSKAMLLDPAEPDSRSAGSFFVNPVVPPGRADAIESLCLERGWMEPGERMPRYPVPGGVKLAAAWLVERAGFPRGTRWGGVGVSSHHALALVNRGGTAQELVELARAIRRAVWERFGVVLEPEPVFAGFTGNPLGELPPRA